MTRIVMCTASGEQHGLINTLSNSVPFDDFKHMTPAHKAKCEKDKKEDARMVKCEYLNSRGKHERLVKPYCKWSGEPIDQYNLIPGQIYDLPMGFIKEVNEVDLPKRSGLVSMDEKNVNSDGSPLAKDQQGDWLHRLVPVSFT